MEWCGSFRNLQLYSVSACMGKACETKIMNGNYIPYPASWIDISVVVKVITVNFMKKWSYLKVKFAQLLMLDTVKFTFLSMQNTVSIHPIFCRSSLNCHYDLSVPRSYGMQKVFSWYQIYFILFVVISKCTNAWSGI